MPYQSIDQLQKEKYSLDLFLNIKFLVCEKTYEVLERYCQGRIKHYHIVKAAVYFNAKSSEGGTCMLKHTEFSLWPQNFQPLSATAPGELNKVNKPVCLTVVQSFILATSGFPKSVQGRSVANLSVKRGTQAYTELHAAAPCPETHRCNTLSLVHWAAYALDLPTFWGPSKMKHTIWSMWNPFLQITSKIHHTAYIRLDANVLYNSVHLGDKPKLHIWLSQRKK